MGKSRTGDFLISCHAELRLPGQLVRNDKWTDNDVIQDDGSASNMNKEQIGRYWDAG